MIQELFKEESLKMVYPKFIPEIYKENRFYACILNAKNLKVFFKEKFKENLVGGYLKAKGIGIWVYKLTGEKNYIKFYVKILSCQYLRQDGYLLSSASINGGTNMPIIDKTIDFENSSEKYEEIIKKLIELLIYLRQEVIYYEN
jgi:hypothetical protein